MPSCATYDDVSLILHLYEIRREERMRDARRWFLQSFHAADFDEFERLCPGGSEQNESFRMVTSYWEMAASFITNGVLQKDLFFESGREMLLVWERIKAIVPAMRKQRSDPTYYANLEAVAGDFAAWLEERAPGTHKAFAKRVTAR